MREENGGGDGEGNGGGLCVEREGMEREAGRRAVEGWRGEWGKGAGTGVEDGFGDWS